MAKLFGINAKLLASHHVECRGRVLHHALRKVPGAFRRQTSTLVQAGEFIGFLQRKALELLSFQSEFSRVHLTGCLDGDPLAHGHRPCTCKQAGQARDEHDPARERGPRYAGNKAEIRNEAVVGAKHPRAHRVARDRTVAALQLSPEDRLSPG